VAFIKLSVPEKLGTPKLCDPELWKVPVTLVQVEAVADEVLVGNHKADVPDGEIVDEPTVGAVEQGGDRERGGAAKRQQLAQVVQRQPRVDHVLDDQNIASLDWAVQILQQPDSLVTAWNGVAVAGKLDKIELVDEWDRAREVGDEEQRSFQRRDEQEVEAVVIGGDLGAQFADARLDLLGGEVGLADAQFVG
jgi:hypothetical protein